MPTEEPKYQPKINLDLYNPNKTIVKRDTHLSGLESAQYFPEAASFGKSESYDTADMSNLNLLNGYYETLRGEKQSGLSQLALTVPRIIAKAGIEIAKTPGYLFALGEATRSDVSLSEALDNEYLNLLEHADDKIKEDLMPVYQSYKAAKGSFWEQVLTTSFVGREVADGVGYLASMMVPGALIKGAGLSAKIAGMGAKAAKYADGLELGAQTLLNTALESSAEAKGISDRLKKEFNEMLDPNSPNYNPINPKTGTMWSKEEVKAAIDESTLNGFRANMALLIAPNAIMNKNLLGRFKADKNILNKYFRNATGELVENPIARKGLVKDYIKAAGIGIGSEGFLEEGGQTSIENYEINKGLGKTDLGFVEGVAKEYINTLTTIEGQKSILLGALLGGLGSVAGQYREDKADKAMFPTISKMIKDNFEGFSVENDIYKKTDGVIDIDPATNQPIVDKVKLVAAVRNFVAESKDGQFADITAINNDKTLHDHIVNQQFARYAYKFMKNGELGMEILNEHLDKASKTRHLMNEASLESSKQDIFDENSYKTNLKEKAKTLYGVYEQTKDTIGKLDILGKLTEKEEEQYAVPLYIAKLHNAIYQENAKQIFFKEKMRDLNSQIMAIQGGPMGGLPQGEKEIEELTQDIQGLNNLLQNSINNYKELFNEEQHKTAFQDMIADIKSQVTAVEEPIVPTSTTSPINTDTQTPTTPTEPIQSTPEQDIETNNKVEEALASTDITTFNTLNNELSKNPYLTNEHKKALIKKHIELTNLVLGDTTEDDNTDNDEAQDKVSIANNLTIPVQSDKDLANQNLILGNKAAGEGSIKSLINVIMMHLFNHKFVNGIFKFTRNEDGNLEYDNTSNLDIDEINRIQVGDKVTLEIVKLTPEASAARNQRIADSIERSKQDPRSKSPIKESDFGEDSIGIFSNGKLIGFVQEPHIVAKDTKNYDESNMLRDSLILYRKAVIEKLKKGETVTEEVEEGGKGTGNLYTKLKPDGTINNSINSISSARDKDKLNNTSLFVYSDGDNLVLADEQNIDISEQDKKDIKERLAAFKGFASAGRVFKLVKDLKGEWSPIPIYAGNMNQTTVDDILGIISTIDNTTNVKTIVELLNNFIYISEYRLTADIKVTSYNGVVSFTINGTTTTLNDINKGGIKKNEFVKDLLSKKQNIPVNNLNNPIQQANLAKRNTLTTNIDTFHGEYFVQPFISYTQSFGQKVDKQFKTEDALNVSTKQPVENDNKSTSLKDKLARFNPSEPLNKPKDDSAASTKKDDTTLDKKGFNKWLASRLPQLSVSDINDITKLKTNITDAFGLFKDLTIYLFEGAGNKTAYHEAFHGVFRNMLTLQERHNLIREAMGKYKEPSAEDLQSLQETLNNEYTNEQLRYLYYEEKLADDFAEFTNDYNNVSLLTKIGRTIANFFKDIAKFFNIFQSTKDSDIQELFDRVNRGKLAKTDIKSIKDIEVFNRPFEEIDSEYAASRELTKILTSANKTKITKAIANKFLSIYQQNVIEGKDVNPLIVYQQILDNYKNEFLSDKHTNNNEEILARIIHNFPALIEEANKFLSYRNVTVRTGKIKLLDNGNVEQENNEDTGIELNTGLPEDNLGDIEDIMLNTEMVKGFGDWTSVAGLTSASTRLKLFLSSIPVLDENNVPQKDEFGVEKFNDFHELYYYIERNLIDLNTLQEHIEKLKSLADGRPVLNQIIDKLTEKPTNMTKEQFELLQNDFKTNFSKQQLVYTLVKFNRDNSTGSISYRIIDANRQTVEKELTTEWINNLDDPNKTTISVHNADGTITKHGTPLAIRIAEQWKELSGKKGEINFNVANRILNNVGIEFSPVVLTKLLKLNQETFKDNVQKILDFYATGDPEVNKDKRIALDALVKEEVATRFDRHTTSFINGENENIFTIQLPSFASRLFNKLTGNNASNNIANLRKDPFYKHNNLLNELAGNTETGFVNDLAYRSTLRVTYLDSLKDDKGEKLGTTFTNMTDRDFLLAELAMFQNTGANKNNTLKYDTAKYVHLTPSDKTMSMIIDGKKYRVSVSIDNHGKTVIKGETSPIIGNFFNVFLTEANRIKKAQLVKEDILTNRNAGKYQLTDLLEHYHISSAKKYNNKKESIPSDWDILEEIKLRSQTEELSDKDWETISSLFNGKAFKFNYFTGSFNNDAADIHSLIESTPIEDLDKVLKGQMKNISETLIIPSLNKDISTTFKEMVSKGIITYNKESKEYSNVSLEMTSTVPANTYIRELVAEYSLNSLLHNIEFSNLLNGDVAMYKDNDLQKRTYQSQAMFTNNNWKKSTIKTGLIKDHNVGSAEYDNFVSILKSQGFNDEQIKEIAGKHQKGINATDAQVYVIPEFYKAIHESRGTWNPLMQEAYDIIEGIKQGDINSATHRLLGTIKPYYYGNRFDEKMGMQKYEQVKCSILPLFKGLIDSNPLLKQKLNDMREQKIDMLAHESAFKALIGNRETITSNNYNVLDLDVNNFGIQVDNPDHLTSGNDATRQIKMLMMGLIDTNKTYKNGKTGSEIIAHIQKMEALNIKSSLKELTEKMDTKNGATFSAFIKKMVTKRGSTSNIEELLTIEDGEFKFALDSGNLSTQVENMISSIYTNTVIKQEFAVGGAAVQASSIGFKYKNLVDQQKNLSPEALIEQGKLKYIAPNAETGEIGYAECALPAHSKHFFNEKGYLKDINNIPDSLKTLIAYRIPYEGLHSTLPIRVVKFLPESMGAIILLSDEITTQMGADFDFDKLYFIGRDFYKQDNNELIPYSYIEGNTPENIFDRYTQHINERKKDNKKPIPIDLFKTLSIEEQNSRGAINNSIFDEYMTMLTDIQNLRFLITPSGFATLEKIKNTYVDSRESFVVNNFFSSTNQRALKERNHIGLALKGQSAIHVSGHSYGMLMNLEIGINPTTGEHYYEYKFLKDGKTRTSFSTQYSDNGKLVADELASLMAAIMDDIKNPLLEPLGINSDTIDVLASILRTGVNMDTALLYLMQPSIKELSKELSNNRNNIKVKNQKFVTPSTIIARYNKKAGNLLKDNSKLIDKVYSSIEKNKLISMLENYRIHNDKVQIISEEGGKKYRDANEQEQLDYYNYQLMIITEFDSMRNIANSLGQINKFYGINKEVGPNIEDIITKRSLLEEINKSKLITGFYLNKIPALAAAWEAQSHALSWFEKYFPYSTPSYTEIKELVTLKQYNKPLNQMSAEDRMLMNDFIKMYTDHSADMFKNVKNDNKTLLVTLPSVINAIQNLNLGKTKFNNTTYEAIRKNLFIQEIKPRIDNANGVSYIQLKGGRLSAQMKENLIEAFRELYESPDTRDLAVYLIEHSFLTSGFSNSIGNYSWVIDPNILEELGYNHFRKNIITNLQNNSLYLPQEKIMDSMIRHYPKKFTKVYDNEMFHEDLTVAVHDNITTDVNFIIDQGKEKEFIFIDENDDMTTPRFIRIYSPIVNKSLLYKFKTNGANEKIFIYEIVEPLGKKGFVTEINDRDDNKSIFAENKVKRPEVQDILNDESNDYNGEPEPDNELKVPKLDEDGNTIIDEVTFEDNKQNQIINFYEGDIKPEPNTIFVFGSNPEGRHGAGAAKIAVDKFGAKYGQGEGLQGNAYALPTKDLRIKENNGFKSISPEQITENIKKLYEVAKQNPNKQFKIAYRNTTDKSLNGYTGLEMIDMFNNAGEIPSNIIFSKEWVDTGKIKINNEPNPDDLPDDIDPNKCK